MREVLDALTSDETELQRRLGEGLVRAGEWLDILCTFLAEKGVAQEELEALRPRLERFVDDRDVQTIQLRELVGYLDQIHHQETLQEKESEKINPESPSEIIEAIPEPVETPQEPASPSQNISPPEPEADLQKRASATSEIPIDPSPVVDSEKPTEEVSVFPSQVSMLPIAQSTVVEEPPARPNPSKASIGVELPTSPDADSPLEKSFQSQTNPVRTPAIEIPREKISEFAKKIETNLVKAFQFYVRRRFNTENHRDFQACQAATKLMKLRDFLTFCLDFQVRLYECPRKNVQGLQILFKLLTSPNGITLPKFVNILKHVALKVREEEAARSRLMGETQVSTEQDAPEEEAPQKLPTQVSDDYFGKPEVYPETEQSQVAGSVHEAPNRVAKSVPKRIPDSEPITFHKQDLNNLTSPEDLEACFVLHMVSLGLHDTQLVDQTLQGKLFPHERDENPGELVRLNSTELEELKFQPDVSQSQEYYQAVAKQQRGPFVRPLQGVREKSQIVGRPKKTEKLPKMASSFKRTYQPEIEEVYERLYYQGTHQPPFVQKLKEIKDKREKKPSASPLPVVRPPAKTTVKLEGYAAKENFKKQAHFLQHINWEIISKMSFSELALQMQEKIGPENFNVLRETLADKKGPTDSKMPRLDTLGTREAMPFQKQTLFLNYGKKW